MAFVGKLIYKEAADPAVGDVVRQYNDDEEKNPLYGLLDDLYENISDEAQAIEGYYDLLEKASPFLPAAARTLILAIIADEKKHMQTLMNIERLLSGVEASTWDELPVDDDGSNTDS